MEPHAPYPVETDPLLGDAHPGSLGRRIESVLTTLIRHQDGCCVACSGSRCRHEVLMSLVLGYQDAPVCLPCLARGLGREPEALGWELVGFILSQECLTIGWRWSNLREADSSVSAPPCRWSRAGPVAVPAAAALPPVPTAAADASWDAADMSCGDLALELRLRIRRLPAGSVLHVRARDPAAPEDLPAWCGLTGHRLVRAAPPDFWIRRKD